MESRSNTYYCVYILKRNTVLSNLEYERERELPKHTTHALLPGRNLTTRGNYLHLAGMYIGQVLFKVFFSSMVRTGLIYITLPFILLTCLPLCYQLMPHAATWPCFSLAFLCLHLPTSLIDHQYCDFWYPAINL